MEYYLFLSFTRNGCGDTLSWKLMPKDKYSLISRAQGGWKVILIPWLALNQLGLEPYV